MKKIFSTIAYISVCLGVRAGVIDSSGYDTNSFVVTPSAGTVRANTNSANPKALATQSQIAAKVSNTGGHITGNLQLDGSLTLLNGIIFSSGAGLGKVYTSDAFGIGSWQSPAFSPFNGASTNQFLENSTNDNSTLSGTTTATGRFNLYDFFTDSGNYRGLSLYPSNNNFYIDLSSAGTGTSQGDLFIRTTANHGIRFATGSTIRWSIEQNGLLDPLADNSYDIGSPTQRPRTIYAGTGFIGDGSQITGLAAANLTGTFPLSVLPSFVVTNNFQPVFTNGGLYISNSAGWVFQGNNGVYVSSNAITRVAIAMDTNRVVTWKSNNLVLATFDPNFGNITIGNGTGNRGNMTGTVATFGAYVGPATMIGSFSFVNDVTVGGDFEAQTATFGDEVTMDQDLTVLGGIVGDGFSISDLNASALTSGTVPLSVLPPCVVTNEFYFGPTFGTFASGTIICFIPSAFSRNVPTQMMNQPTGLNDRTVILASIYMNSNGGGALPGGGTNVLDLLLFTNNVYEGKLLTFTGDGVDFKTNSGPVSFKLPGGGGWFLGASNASTGPLSSYSVGVTLDVK